MTESVPKPSFQTGLDLLSMTDLSPLQKVILRTVLRKVRISEPDLVTAINAMTWESQPKYEDVMTALEDMVNRTYLSRAAEQGVFFYGPNLQRKQGIRSMDIVLSNRAGGSMAPMWQALQTMGEREPATGGQMGETTGNWAQNWGSSAASGWGCRRSSSSWLFCLPPTDSPSARWMWSRPAALLASWAPSKFHGSRWPKCW
jgi:predicted transcriptional regulator